VKVSELIEVLKTLPQDAELVVQKDSEGNGYSPLSGAEAGYYHRDTDWSGDFMSSEEDYLDYFDYDGEDALMPYEENAVVLYPVN